MSQNDDNFRVLFETIDDLVAVCSCEGTILFANPAFTRTLGYPVEQLAGMNICALYGEGERVRASEVMSSVLNEECNDFSLPMTAKDGRVIPMETRVWPGTWNGEKAIFGYSKDLTHSRAELEKFRKVFDFYPSPTVLSTADSQCIVTVNRAFEKVLGYDEKEVVGKTSLELGLFDDQTGEKQAFDELQRTGYIRDLVMKVRSRDGTLRTGVLYAEFMQQENETLILTTMIDITGQRKVEKQLKTSLAETEVLNRYLQQQNARINRMAQQAQAANTAKSIFLANMSHEIRTPMNGILGMTELLLASELDPGQRQYAETVKYSGDHLLEIINDILDVSKIEAGKFELKEKPFVLYECIEDAVRMCLPRIHGRDIELILYMDPAIPEWLKGDSQRCRQIVINVLGNAVKYTQQGEIGVCVMKQHEISQELTLRISVSDTGVGIPESEKEHIFDSFSQLETSMRKKYGGTGLGLSITKKLCEQMGGDISVESVKGKGSVFTCRIRLATCAHSPQSEDATADLADGLSVLVALKHEMNRMYVSALCNAWGCGVYTLENPARIDKIVREQSGGGGAFDAMVVDPGAWAHLCRELPEYMQRYCTNNPSSVIILDSANSSGEETRNCALERVQVITVPIFRRQLYNALTIAGNISHDTTSMDEGTGYTLRRILSECGPRRILLAEDDATNQKVFISMLQRYDNIGIEIAHNGVQVLRMCKEHAYDCIFMDCQMPEMDGFEAARRVRAAEERSGSRRIPIVALTAYALQGDRDKCTAAGMDEYITKPFRTCQIESLLAKWVCDFDAGASGRGASQDAQPQAGSFGDEVQHNAENETGMPFDREGLLQRFDGDREIAAVTLRAFLDDMPTKLQFLQEAVASNDPDAVARAGHTIKGACATAGLESMRCDAMQIETAGKAGNMVQARICSERLNREWLKCKEIVVKALNEFQA